MDKLAIRKNNRFRFFRDIALLLGSTVTSVVLVLMSQTLTNAIGLQTYLLGLISSTSMAGVTGVCCQKKRIGAESAQRYLFEEGYSSPDALGRAKPTVTMIDLWSMDVDTVTQLGNQYGTDIKLLLPEREVF